VGSFSFCCSTQLSQKATENLSRTISVAVLELGRECHKHGLNAVVLSSGGLASCDSTMLRADDDDEEARKRNKDYLPFL